MLDKANHPSQIALREKHSELLLDIEAVAERATAARHEPRKNAPAILEAAEAALVRVSHEWRKSRGGNHANYFFTPLSKRLRRVIGYYRSHLEKKPEVAEDSEPANWLYRITDYEALPFQRLKPWFRASAVDDAIKMGILLGLRELPGLMIWKDET